MSDYEQSRYPRPTSIDTGGAGAFWVLVVVVALGALVLIMAVGTATVPGDPSAAGADSAPAIAPAEPDAATSGAATGTDAGAASGTVIE
ncbi:MAG: hypothetical protein AAFZ04_14835 [Pseudomonadota bacterium]